MARSGKPMIGLLAVLVVVLLALDAAGSMSVAPLSLQLDLPPGESGSGSFLVRNTGAEVIDVAVSLHDWWRSPEGNLQVLPAGSIEGSCADWVVYSTEVVTLAPGEETEITVEVLVPEDVTGDHWAMLLVEERPQPAEQAQAEEGLTDTTRVVVAYAVKILQRDPVNEEAAAMITKIEIVEPQPLQLAITFVNSGNAHITTSGTVEVRDVYGETAESFEIEPFPSLPGEERILTVAAPESLDGLQAGTYYAVVQLDFGGDYLIQGGRLFDVSVEASED
jgi:hypothetical protein